MDLVHLPPTADATVIDAVLRRDGALIVDDLAPPGAVDAVLAEMAPYIDATPGGSDDFSGRRTRRSGALIARSAGTRIGLNITYDVGWLRQEENQYLSVPLEVAATLDDDLLRLMGYRLGAYALGYVDDARDPLEVVRGRRGVASFRVDG